MKKSVLSLILAFLLLITSLPAAAAEQTPPLRFEYCDNYLLWGNGGYPSMSLTSDSTVYTEAPCSLKVSGDLSQGTSMVLIYRSATAYDITDYTYLEFDVYMTLADKRVLATGGGQLELTSSGACDVAELAFGATAVLDQIQKDGWNHIQIPLANGGTNTTDPQQVYDPTHVNYFRFYVVNLSGQEKGYTYYIDNLFFSNGEGVMEDALPPSDYQPGAPCRNNGYSYGDLAADGAVNAADALNVLQYAVDKATLTNQQLAMGDVNHDGLLNAADALNILQKAVNKIDAFSVERLETLPETVEVGVNESHLVHTQYPTDTRVIAETDVIYWGAKGDGITDDTLAFQKAIAYAAGLEGGTVFVPAGRYVIRGTLMLPNGVTLQGDSPEVSDKDAVEGTVLMAYDGRGNADGTPFIRMDSSSALANLSIWYPEQTMDNIVPYPWTIRQAGHYGIAVSNVRLVNSYQGIGMFYTNSLQNIRGVVGTPLKTGLILDGNVDICRVENVTFTPDCWLNSGLSDNTHGDTMKQYLYENATAFKFEHVDWTYVTDITAVGYYVALGNSKPTTRESESSPNGHVFHVDFRDCYIGYDATYVNPIGMMITEGTIQAEIPVRVPASFCTSVSLNHLQLISTGNTAVLMEGTGVVTLENCRVTTQNGVGVEAKSGKLSLSFVQFENCVAHLRTYKTTEAVTMTNCMTKDTLKLADSANVVKALWNSSLTVAEYNVEDYDYNQKAVPRTAGDAFADITKVPYGADTSNTEDIAGILQQALNDVYEQGGGVVYVPSGRYRLDSAVTVPAGVELRGSCTFPQHSHAYSTTFYTTYGRGENADATALLTLAPTAGINGFKVYYDRQPGGVNSCESYAFTVRGTGINNYILNVDFINSFYQTDLATNRCDGHYVNGATGYPLEQGVVVGGGSTNGIVRDCQFNLHYFSDNPIYRTMDVDETFLQYATDHSEAFVVGDTTHQIMYHNFVLGVHSGIAIDNGADVFVLAHGTDGGDRSMTVRGTPSGKVTFVNTQLVVIGPGSTMAYINIEESFTGTVNMTQTNLWGQPTACSILVGGGRLNLSQGTNVRSGNIGVKVWNGADLYMDTVYHMRNDLLYDLHLDQVGSVVTYGNIYAGGGRLYDLYDSYGGNEF